MRLAFIPHPSSLILCFALILHPSSFILSQDRLALLPGELAVVEIPLASRQPRTVKISYLPCEGVELLETCPSSPPFPYWRTALVASDPHGTVTSWRVPPSRGGKLLVRLRSPGPKTFGSGLITVLDGKRIETQRQLQLSVSPTPSLPLSPSLCLGVYDYADRPKFFEATRQQQRTWCDAHGVLTAWGHQSTTADAAALRDWAGQWRPGCARYVLMFTGDLDWGYTQRRDPAAGVAWFRGLADRARAAGLEPGKLWLCFLDEAYYSMTEADCQRALWYCQTLADADCGIRSLGHCLFSSQRDLGPQLYRDYCEALDLAICPAGRMSGNAADVVCDPFAREYYARIAARPGKEAGVYQTASTATVDFQAYRFLFWTAWLRDCRWLSVWALGDQGDAPDDPPRATRPMYSPAIERPDGTIGETMVSLQMELGRQDYCLFEAAKNRATPQELAALRACVQATYWDRPAAEVRAADPRPAVNLARWLATRE